jgi:N-alpha-acetyltransferase 35, NatC auxiliary subunit
MGHPLSQTIFTSLYVDKLLNSKKANLDEIRFEKLTDASYDEPLNICVLRAYCLGLLMTCSHVNNRVKSEHFHEVLSLC